MTWWVQPLEIADAAGKGTGRWRMTAKSDEGGGGPYGDTSHDHASPEEAQACDRCDEYTSRWTGFPSRRQESAREAEKRVRDAAPEMLDVLDAWSKAMWMAGYEPKAASNNPIEELLARTHAAIAKARGQA